MNETLEIIQSEFAQASFETFEMVLISMIAAAILGTILGLVLHLASNPIFYKNRVVNGITGTIINVIRSLPFIILIIVLQPLARLVVGTSTDQSQHLYLWQSQQSHSMQDLWKVHLVRLIRV